LREEGGGFHALLSDMRRRQALPYLEDPDLSVLDIALLLSYSDAAAFARAFKAATGGAVSAHRRQSQLRRQGEAAR